jgi:PAS domain S-box-containing protein
MSLEVGKFMNQRTGTPDNLPSTLTQKTQRVGTILHLADGTIQACDSIAADLLGHTIEQLIGKTSFDQPWQTVHRDGSPFISDDYPNVVAVRTGKPCENVSIGFYRPSGDLVWLEVNATPLFHSSSPEPYAVMVMLREADDQDTEAIQKLDRFQVLVEHASEQIALLTEDCQFSYVNEAFCENHGYTRDEIRSLHGYDVNVEGSLEEFRQLWNMAQQQPSVRLNVQHQTKLGEKFDLDVTLKFFQFDGEAFLCGFARDITDNKRSQRLLSEHKRLLELVASGQPLNDCLAAVCQAIAALSPGTRACFLVADAQRRTFPYSITPDLPDSFGQGLKNAPITEVFIGTCAEAVYCGHPITCADVAHDDRWAQEWRDLTLSHGILACYSAPVIGVDHLPMASLMLCFDQARVPTNWELQLAEFGAQVASIAFERDRSLLALRQSEERLHLGIQVAGIALVRFDYASNTIAVSPEAAAMYGISLDGLTGPHDRLYTVLDTPETTELIDIIQQALKAESLEGTVQEYRVTLKSGEIRWLNVRKQVFFDRSGEAPRADYAIIAAMDIIDRKQAELERDQLLAEAQAARAEAEAASRSKDEFVAIVAHELRSPLNSVAGWAKLLQIRKFDEEKTAKALDTIWRNTQTQIQLVEDLLDISRMIKGNLQLTIAPVNLAAVAEAAVNLVSPQAQAKQIQIDLQLDRTARVSGDFNRLQQVMVNLLTNAIKFTPEQGRIEVQVESLEAQVQLSVSDTGKGISPEFLHQIFERFQQGQKNTGSKDGLGLGLAIVKNLVELHHGTITVESEGVGKGATFTIQLPSLNTPAVQPEPMPIAQRINPLARVRILVADDEPDMLSLIVFVLEETGAEVRAVQSGSAALECLEEFQPDILISDISMPEGDGYELIRQVRSRSKNLPAIALTAYASATHEERSLQAGFQQHFTKPFESESLITAIINLIDLGQPR